MKQIFKMLLSAILCLGLLLQVPVLGSLSAAADASTFTITGLQVEQQDTPLGIDVEYPAFSWRMESDVRGIRQAYYQIKLDTDPAKLTGTARPTWRSDKVGSDGSVDIRYEGRTLASGTRYYWNVTVWDNQGNSVTSDISWFETGLLSDSDWSAQWIQADESAGYHPDAYTIDFDFCLLNHNLGFVFAAKDTSNFLMWQINTREHNGALYLRPHQWVNGGATCLDEVAIPTAVVPANQYFTPHHMTIAVNGNTITTSIDGTQVDSRTSTLAGYGRIGFRMISNSVDNEQGAVDNLVVQDAAGSILVSEDFSDPDHTIFSFGQVTDGWLQVSNVLELQTLENDNAPMYRKTFDISKSVASARLYATALGLYQAQINGQTVGEDLFAPGWTTYEKAQQRNYVLYQTYDVTDLLQSGDNCIGFTTGHGWYSGKLFLSGNNNYGTGSKLLAQLVITYNDGSTETVATDNSWKISQTGPITADDFQDGESYDANLEKDGWYTAAYTEDSSWTAAQITDYDGALQAMVGPAVREVQAFAPKSITEVNPGTWIVDLGQNIAGYARISMTQPAGTQIRLRFGEMLNQDGTLYTANLRTAKATDYYTFRGETNGEIWQPIFTFHGFQYIEVTGLQGELTSDMITGVAVSSLQEATGFYETSNAKVNQLFSNINWGQRDNYISVPTDCPQRDERLGYTGDGQVFVRSGSLNYDVCSFFHKYMQDVLANQQDDGNVPDWTPNYITAGDYYSGSYGNSGWGDAICIIPWTVYTAYGDTEILEMCYDGMKKWLDYYQSKDPDKNNLISSGTNGDWLSTEGTGMEVISTGYWAYDCLLTAKIAGVLGNTADQALYQAKYEAIRDAFLKKYVKADGTVENGSQCAQLIALKFQLVEGDQAQLVADKLVENIVSRDYHLSTGFIGVAYLCPMLSEYGYSDVAYKLLLQETYPSWLYSVNAGATTIWERWNSYNSETGQFGDVGMNSFNHYSLGSVAEWMYGYSAGILYDENEPGYQHFTVRPEQGGGLDYVNCTFESVYGTIVSNWRYLDATTLQMEVTVPANTTATVSVPTVDADSVTESGQHAGAAEGVTFVAYENGRAVYEVGAGVYQFQSTVEQRQVLVSVAAADTPCSITLNGQTYTLPANVEVPAGTEVTLTATPLDSMNNRFLAFTGDVTGYDSTVTFTADGSKNIAVNTAATGLDNLALGGAVTASSSYSTGNGTWGDSNLTDGDYTSAGGYCSQGFDNPDQSANPLIVTVDLGSQQEFQTLTLFPRQSSVTDSGTAASYPSDFSIAVSNDGSVWQTVYAATGETAAPNQAKTYSIDPVTARYVRLTVTTLGERPTDDVSYRLQLVELGVYDAVRDQTNLLQQLVEETVTKENAADVLSQANYLLGYYDFPEDQEALIQDKAQEARELLAQPDLIPGDLNGDGNLSVTDVVLLRKAILSGSFAQVGDLNGDNALSVTDVVLLRKEILKM